MTRTRLLIGFLALIPFVIPPIILVFGLMAIANLFVVDGSSFATSAAVNPTSTIGALALRAADGIWERRREL